MERKKKKRARGECVTALTDRGIVSAGRVRSKGKVVGRGGRRITETLKLVPRAECKVSTALSYSLPPPALERRYSRKDMILGRTLSEKFFRGRLDRRRCSDGRLGGVPLASKLLAAVNSRLPSPSSPLFSCRDTDPECVVRCVSRTSIEDVWYL